MVLQLTVHNSLHMQPFHLGPSAVRMQIFQTKSITNIDFGMGQSLHDKFLSLDQMKV